MHDIGQQWSWKPNDKVKPLQECLQTLVKVVCGDGNLLFNVGPMPDGRIEPRQVERLKEMGNGWPSTARVSMELVGDRSPGRLGWRHLQRQRRLPPYSRSEARHREIPAIERRSSSHRVLTGGTATVKQDADSVEISVPKDDRQEIDTIVVLKLEAL